tara:strand:- start:190 stop:438 length:249 start_codon:yes stop_codon:yes gene_type:complete
MSIFWVCPNGKTHFPTAKEYRYYYRDKKTAKCKCKGLGICLEKGAGKAIDHINKICKRCNTIKYYPKKWQLRCSTCSPKGGK